LLSVERVFPLLYGSYGIGMFDSAKSDADHNRGSSIRRRGTGRRNHVCPKCGNGYSVVKSLRRHLRYECGLTPRFKCPYCGTRSKQRGHVSQHIRRKHSGQRVYIIDSPWWWGYETAQGYAALLNLPLCKNYSVSFAMHIQSAILFCYSLFLIFCFVFSLFNFLNAFILPIFGSFINVQIHDVVYYFCYNWYSVDCTTCIVDCTSW